MASAVYSRTCGVCVGKVALPIVTPAQLTLGVCGEPEWETTYVSPYPTSEGEYARVHPVGMKPMFQTYRRRGCEAPITRALTRWVYRG